MTPILIILFFLLGIYPARAELPPQLVPAIDKVFNADFAGAAPIIQSYISTHPEDSSGYLLRGMMNEWDQTVNNKANTLNGTIMSDYKKANELASAQHEADPTNISKSTLLANTYLYVSKKMVDMGQKMRAGFELKKAKILVEDVLSKDPTNIEGFMPLGSFNYFSASAPSGLKWLASLLGFNGNKAKGIEYLTKAAQVKTLTQNDALFLLTYIYSKKEKNNALANQYNDQLKQRYPNNPSFQYATGDIYNLDNNTAAARTSFTQFLNWCEGKPQNFCNTKYIFFAKYFLAKGYLKDNNDAQADRFIQSAIAMNEKSYKGSNVDLLLWAGQIAKRAGKKDKALEYFKQIEERQSDNPGDWAKAQEEMKGL